MPTKGGGSQTQSTAPWTGARPYILDALGRASAAANQPPQFFEGDTFVGGTPAEAQGWQQRRDYTGQVFNGSPAPQYSDLVNTTGSILRGDGAGSNLAGSLSPYAMQGISQGFGNQGMPQLQQRSFDSQLNPNQFSASLMGPDQIQQRSFDSQLNPGAFAPGVQGPYDLQQRSFDPRLDMSSFTPGFGQAGGLDARAAYQQQLSGQPDYAGAQGAITAANAPLLRDFEQNLLPQIAGRSGISGHDTGSIKLLNRTLPELGERMSTNAMGIMEGERQRALGAQERAAGAITQGGYQGYGLGLQGAGQDLASRQALAQFGVSQDLARSDIGRGYNADTMNAYGLGLQGAQSQAGLNQQSAQYDTNQQLAQANLNAGFRADQLQNYGLGLQGAGQQAGLNQQAAQFGLNQDLSRFGLQNDYRNQAMSLAQLSGNLGDAQTRQQLAAASMWPSIYQTGQEPSTQQMNYAGYDRGLQEQQLDDQIRRWDFQQNQPMNMAQWYSNIAQGFGGLGSTTTGNSNSSSFNVGSGLQGLGGLLALFGGG